ncbi:hypothetical protein [Peribacillus simplex]|uniref:hypothetical protein n=1 Tax=Peribacillus simplex TaxID=1478 RepID=UPI003D2C0C0D
MTEHYDVKILLKFVESQFVESTLGGKFYFSRNRNFIDLEKQQIDKGIGDKREGVWSEVFNPETEQIFIENKNGEKLRLNVKKAVFRQTYEDVKDLPICCFVALSLKEDFEVNEEESKMVLKPEIKKKLVEQFLGRELIMFFDSSELIKRFDSACEKENLDRIRGKVTYYDDEIEPHPLSQEDFDKFPDRALMYKRKFFEFQKEYRIVITEPHQNDIILNVGDVRDIARNLGKIESDKLPLDIVFKHV